VLARYGLPAASPAATTALALAVDVPDAGIEFLAPHRNCAKLIERIPQRVRDYRRHEDFASGRRIIRQTSATVWFVSAS